MSTLAQRNILLIKNLTTNINLVIYIIFFPFKGLNDINYIYIPKMILQRIPIIKYNLKDATWMVLGKPYSLSLVRVLVVCTQVVVDFWLI